MNLVTLDGAKSSDAAVPHLIVCAAITTAKGIASVAGEVMKPVLFTLAGFVILSIAAIHFYPVWFARQATQDVLKLSGSIEAHESQVSFKVTGRIIKLPIVREEVNYEIARLAAILRNPASTEQESQIASSMLGFYEFTKAEEASSRASTEPKRPVRTASRRLKRIKGAHATREAA